MNTDITALCILVLYVILMTVILPWVVHISQVKVYAKPYGWSTLKKFKENFVNHNWDNHGWTNSWFDRNSDSEFHARIVKFDGKGMILRDPISWMLAVRFAKRYNKKPKQKENTVVW